MPQPKLSIALDATYAADPQPTGIGIYSQRLIAALADLPLPSPARLVLAFRPGPYFRQARRQSWPERYTLSPLIDRWITWPRVRLFHGLNQRLPERHYARTVVTLHERFPAPADGYSTAEFRAFMSRRIERALGRADRIIVVSHSVRAHLTAQRPQLAPKIRVVHHGVDHHAVGPAGPVDTTRQLALLSQRLQLDPGAPFFLNVGAVQVRKNLKNLLLALQPLAGAQLVIAGNDGFGAREIHEFANQPVLSGRVRFAGHLQPGELRLLYAAATALVFPSLEEAFGMPVLEAMAGGCPVITSNVSALPEVAGEAALLIDPKSVDELRAAMQRLLADSALAADLRRRGAARAAEFSWEKCARETWAVYQELL